MIEFRTRLFLFFSILLQFASGTGDIRVKHYAKRFIILLIVFTSTHFCTSLCKSLHIKMTHNHVIVSLILLLPLLVQISYSQPTTNLCHPHDKNVLLRIKNHFGNPSSLSSWDTNTDCALWKGIRCNDQGHVTVIIINTVEDIHGPIPPFLDQLPSLTELYFFELPNLSGPIPSYIGKLTKLTHLTITTTNVSGLIPEFLGQLTNLDQLFLASNKLTGPVPDFLGQFKKLIYLDLSSNLLTGTIPVALGKLTNLEILMLSSNKLSGKIPDFIGKQLNNLLILALDFNSLSGAIPASLSLLLKLQNLALAGNQLTGPVPKWLGRGNLSFLYLSHNKLTGDASFLFEKTNTNILNLRVEYNLLKFDFTNVDLAPSLLGMNISHNMIYGSLPKRFGVLQPDEVDVIRYNQLCGPIPNGRRFKRVNPNIFAHNKCLCGGPFPGCK
ncbi:polygalacturonase inhibitor 2-like [Beta vulgaris subsp. vulgaris]|uniref:polygalacturonase inhibitor 2-like n=1 Tax=Beta vulgaris subsp. vulgaris TaxID=3555 RepID=UPI002549909E|nr:polygalacturonase inhibitor 2-like [Beta vulgaris subsp. vulgaris]